MNNLHKVNETFRERVATETKNDDDVQFLLVFAVWYHGPGVL